MKKSNRNGHTTLRALYTCRVNYTYDIKVAVVNAVF